MKSRNNIVDNLANIYMESFHSSNTINEQSMGKVWVAVYQEQHLPGGIVTLGIYTSPEAAQKAMNDYLADEDDDTDGYVVKEVSLNQPADWYYLRK